VAKSQGNADEDWQKHLAARKPNAPPSLPLAQYAARIAIRGTATSTSRTKAASSSSVLEDADLVGDIQPWQNDTFVIKWRERWLNADAFLSFNLDADGKIREARMEPISPLTDFSFDFQDCGWCRWRSSRAHGVPRGCSLALDALSQTLCEALDRFDDRCRLA
jgi:hypothetical protein